MISCALVDSMWITVEESGNAKSSRSSDLEGKYYLLFVDSQQKVSNGLLYFCYTNLTEEPKALSLGQYVIVRHNLVRKWEYIHRVKPQTLNPISKQSKHFQNLIILFLLFT